MDQRIVSSVTTLAEGCREEEEGRLWTEDKRQKKRFKCSRLSEGVCLTNVNTFSVTSENNFILTNSPLFQQKHIYIF